MSMGIEELRNNLDIANRIDWDMTPEEAVTLYLEWGNNWSHGRLIRSRTDESYYFVVYAWDNPPKVLLIRRTSEEAVELATIELPWEMGERFMASIRNNKGVYAPNREIKEWLARELYGSGETEETAV